LEKILEYSVRCPLCGGTINVSEYLYEAPCVGKLILAAGKCGVCGYRWSDVRLAESHGFKRIRMVVEKPGDLNALVIRSSTASIKIPELGVEINPGYGSTGYITTVEGVVRDIYDKTQFICSDEDAPRENCLEKLELINRALNGALRFTIILEDPMGVSKIVSDKAVEE